ncbi:hypothetical protein J7E83_20635 [Arthrobacter sp. ISL-48]|uniref:hypothetical protein n=1 Tax=Arthrobacter sp. ISL-48 TaxID=2819110 RepID=UPI001BE86402|nr:hypothetical protein [Arthrobacter sp. ISL-48]MBT2534490.1 hypothetical protein [Arthrobacter sp. ISL-48]
MPDILKSFDYKSLVPGALVALVSYVAVLIIAVIFLVLGLVGLSASNGGSAEVPSSSVLPSGTVPSPWSLVGQLAVQLVVMSQFGALGSSIDATIPFIGNVHGSASVFAVPLLLTAVSIVVLFLGGRSAAKRVAGQPTTGIWVESLITGLVFTLLVNISGAVFGISMPTPSVKISPIGAVTFGSVLVALAIGMFATLAGRSSVRPRADASVGVRAAVRHSLEAVTVHYGIFLSVAIPVVVVILGIKSGWQATLSAPLWAPTAGFFLFGLAHLSAVSRTWNFGSSVSSSSNSSGSDISFGFGSALAQYGVPGWAGWLLLLLALISLLVTSIFWYLRRGPIVANKITDWLVLPAAFPVAGALLTWLSSVSGTFDAGSLATGAGSVTLAWWTPFFMILWGGATEASARYAAPHLSRYVPLALVQKLVPTRPAATVPAVIAPAAPDIHEVPAESGEPATGQTIPTGHPAPGDHPALAPREPLSGRTKRTLGLVLGGVGLVVVLVVGAATTVNVIKGGKGPDKPVNDYLQALQNGEASKAMALSDPGLANDQRALLTDQVYAKAGKRIDGFDIVSTTVAEDHATVVAEMHQDGRKQQTTFNLRRVNPELLDDHWKMDSSPLGALTITSDTPVQTVLVNGQELNVGLTGSRTGSGGANFPALPGEYTVELPSSEKYLTAPKSTTLVAIGAQAPPTASLKVDATEALKTEALAQVDAHLAECIKSTDARPANCPFSSYVSSSYSRNFHWSLTTKPTFSLSKDPYGSSAWRIRTETPGKATASYERDSSYGFGTPDWKPTTDTTSVSLSASVTLEDGKVKLTYSNY